MIDTDIIFLGSHYSGGRYGFGTKNGILLPSGFYDTRAGEHLINVGWVCYCKK